MGNPGSQETFRPFSERVRHNERKTLIYPVGAAVELHRLIKLCLGLHYLGGRDGLPIILYTKVFSELFPRCFQSMKKSEFCLFSTDNKCLALRHEGFKVICVAESVS